MGVCFDGNSGFKLLLIYSWYLQSLDSSDTRPTSANHIVYRSCYLVKDAFQKVGKVLRHKKDIVSNVEKSAELLSPIWHYISYIALHTKMKKFDVRLPMNAEKTMGMWTIRKFLKK